MKQLLLFIAAWLIASVSYAFTPEVGAWQIDAEANGQPGRGFTVDQQGGVLVLTAFAFQANGAQGWYVAAGPLNGYTFSGVMSTYSGGTTFGGTFKNSVASGTAGTVSITFTDALHGTITFPGESPKAVSRLNYGRPANPLALDGTWGLVKSTLITNGTVYDTSINPATFTASGTMRVNGSTASQAISVSLNGGTPQSATVTNTISDQTTYLSLTTSTGSKGTMYIIKRGEDEFISFTASASLTEIDYWRRVSPSSTATINLNFLEHRDALLDSVDGLAGSVAALALTQ